MKSEEIDHVPMDYAIDYVAERTADNEGKTNGGGPPALGRANPEHEHNNGNNSNGCQENTAVGAGEEAERDTRIVCQVKREDRQDIDGCVEFERRVRDPFGSLIDQKREREHPYSETGSWPWRFCIP